MDVPTARLDTWEGEVMLRSACYVAFLHAAEKVGLLCIALRGWLSLSNSSQGWETIRGVGSVFAFFFFLIQGVYGLGAAAMGAATLWRVSWARTALVFLFVLSIVNTLGCDILLSFVLLLHNLHVASQVPGSDLPEKMEWLRFFWFGSLALSLLVDALVIRALLGPEARAAETQADLEGKTSALAPLSSVFTRGGIAGCVSLSLVAIAAARAITVVIGVYRLLY